MGYSVRLAQAAEEDAAAIVDYLAGTLISPQAADRFVATFVDVIATLETLPESYPPVEEPILQGRGYRKAQITNYLAIFRVEDKTVYVVRIVHQSQDYARLL